MEFERLGEWVFILGVVIAIIAGLAVNPITDTTSSGYIIIVLVILGFIVGFLNINDKEIFNFLIAVIAIELFTVLQATNLQLQPLAIIGQYISAMLTYIAAFVAPAGLVVALKAVYNLASKKG